MSRAFLRGFKWTIESAVIELSRVAEAMGAKLNEPPCSHPQETVSHFHASAGEVGAWPIVDWCGRCGAIRVGEKGWRRPALEEP